MRWKRISAALALALALACSLLATKIGDIRRDPARFEGKTVTVKGKVSEPSTIPFVGKSIFTVDDGTGAILVVTERGLPKDASTVSVTGQVTSALRIGGTSYGLMLKENPR